jgi:hypothetical protein
MNEVRLARGALLAGMVALGKFVRLADEFQIVVGTVLAHVAHELTELGYGEHIGRDLFAQGGHSLFLIISGWATYSAVTTRWSRVSAAPSLRGSVACIFTQRLRAGLFKFRPAGLELRSDRVCCFGPNGNQGAGLHGQPRVAVPT